MTTMTTSPTASAPSASPPSSGTVQPKVVQEWLGTKACVLIDVREADEFAAEHVPNATLHPLSRFDPTAIRPEAGQRVVLMCRSGRRSADAAARCDELRRKGFEVVGMAGGIEAWRAAALPVERTTHLPRLGVLQQTQITIGVVSLVGVALGFAVHEVFFGLPTLMGCGLILAGVTGHCPLATLISHMPWNKRLACADGSCGHSHS